MELLVRLAIAAALVVACAAPPPSPTATSTEIPTPSLPPITGGGSGEDEDPPIYSFSEPSALDELAWKGDQETLKLYCEPVAPPSHPTFDEAMADVRQRLDTIGNGGLLTAMEQSGALSSAAEAGAAAAGAAAQGNVAGAVAALLQQIKAEPGNAAHLTNAAAMLTTMELPGDAIAFLDQAASLPPATATPMGIDPTAALLANRGTAEFDMGQLDAAAADFEQALALDGNLVEAARGLAHIGACQGKAAFVNAARRRRSEVSRLPRGTDGVLPVVNYPSDPADGAQLYETYKAVDEEIRQKQQTLYQQYGALVPGANTAYQLPVSLRRARSIEYLMDTVENRPDVKPLWDEVFKRNDGIEAVYNEVYNQNGAFGAPDPATCQGWLRDKHRKWRGAMDSYDTAVRNYYKVAYRIRTQLIGLVQNETWHQLLVNKLQQFTNTTYSAMLVGNAMHWTYGEAFLAPPKCVSGEAPPGGDVPDDAGTADADGCKGLDLPNGFGPAIKLGEITIKVKCEKVSLEVSGFQTGPLSVFAQFTGSNIHGQKGYSFFGGPKVGVKVPLGGNTEVSVSSKSGFYLTVERGGEIYDYGWRVSPLSVAGNEGALGLTVWEAKSMDFSFVGITDYMPIIGTK